MYKDASDFWITTGRENPYWGVSTHERFRGKQLDKTLAQEFFDSGAVEINSSLELLYWLCGFKGTPGNAIDFGCGVGRLAIPMARVMGHVYGVDVSQDIMEKANEHATESGLYNISFSTNIPEVKADWINSFIVFQHIPPKMGYSLLDELMSRLQLGGVFSLHFPIYREGSKLPHEAFGRCAFNGEQVVLLDDFPISKMPMYDYDAANVFKILFSYGVGEFMLRHVNHSGAHGMWLFGRKND